MVVGVEHWMRKVGERRELVHQSLSLRPSGPV